MKFTQNVVLLGVVGKKGSGKLDNGNDWATDRVELHCLTPFTESDSMSHGKTVTCYQVQDYNAHYEPAKNMIDQEIELQMEMQPAKKLGQAPKIICTGFRLLKAPAQSKTA